MRERVDERRSVSTADQPYRFVYKADRIAGLSVDNGRLLPAAPQLLSRRF
jgi:hypothetical protein